MKKALLLILDGWGYSERLDGNAIRLASPPFYNSALEKFPWTLLSASGEDVGLSDHQMGNSEVGHLNIGAGRLVEQDLVRIDKMIRTGAFFTHAALNAFIDDIAKRGGDLHVMGLLSPGGVHSHQSHLYALLKLIATKPVKNVFIHCFLDGRDTPPRSAGEFIAALEAQLADKPSMRIASVGGRYYGMDRDKRWEREEKAYRCLTDGVGREAASPQDALAKAYAAGEDDEFVIPTVVVQPDGKPTGVIKDGDGVIFFNFRADRARQITHALTDESFTAFPRPKRLDITFFSFSQYEDDLHNPALLDEVNLKQTVTELLSTDGLKVFKIAETEKYAHVTYFFNGGAEVPFPLEERLLVPSPKVATYDLKPQMSVYEVTSNLIKKMEAGQHALYVANFANGDMVGHTGVITAAVEAVKHVDNCLAKLWQTAKRLDMAMIVTSDHGNCDEMLDENGRVLTQHSLNPVPLIVMTNDHLGVLSPNHFALRDVVPTVLDVMQVDPSPPMNGRSLIKH
jgi:2,3-bisphosphoglycerate-independent phosphoglycerate mutase